MTDKITKNDFENYEKSFIELKKALDIVSSKESSLDEVLIALDKGLKAHKICTDILSDAEQKIREISLTYKGGEDEF